MMNATEATEAGNAVKYPYWHKGKDLEGHRVDMALYRECQREIDEQFKTWLAVTYSPNMPEAADELIWDKAWADGHHAGYHEVESHYHDYAEFATAIANTLR